MPIEFTDEQINDMREWLKDCAGTYEQLEQIEDATSGDIIRWTEQYFDGGTHEFILASMAGM